MRGNNIYSGIFLSLFVLTGMQTHAQTENPAPAAGRGQYALVAYISGGIGYFANNAGAASFVTTKVNKWGPAASIRILWHPDHLLRMGIESGHMTFYSYTIKDSVGNMGKTSLTGVPLLLVASMPVTARLNAFFGTGFYHMTTNLDYKGSTSSGKFAVGWMIAASYIQPLSKTLGLGTELKLMDAAETADASVVAQLQLVWKFLKW